MRFAAISDIHGNLAAIEAVFVDIDKLEEPVEMVVCTGDMVGHFAHPNEVLDLLAERKVELLRGNYDEASVGVRSDSGVDFISRRERDVDAAAVKWTREQLTEANFKLLREMRQDARMHVTSSGRQATPLRETKPGSDRSGVLMGMMFGSALTRKTPRAIKPREILFVHGSPRDPIEYIYPDTAISLLEAMAQKARAEIVIHGHTHMTSESVGGRTAFIGVGSVGKSRAGGMAEYAIVDIVESEIDVEFRPVSYDVEREIRDVEHAGLPRELADVLRTGSFPQAASSI